MTDFLERDIQRAWLLTLIDAWQRIKRTTPGLQRLKLPNFAIEPKQRTLGTWTLETRLITLSTRLFQRAEWSVIEETLRHEIAHQISDELYGADSETSHGPAFRRACVTLGIDPAATRALTGEDGPDLPAIVARIRKLFALGESSNPHEAELALKKAHELLLKYNIQHLDAVSSGTARADGYSFRVVGAPMRRVPNYVWAVANLCAEFYFVQYIGQQFLDPLDQLGGGPEAAYRVIEFYGTPENLDLAEYVYHFLMHEGEREWRRYQRQNRLPSDRLKRSFLNGLYEGFRKGLTRQKDTLKTEQALVWLGDPALETYYTGRNPRVRRRAAGSRLDPEVHADGVVVGKSLKIRPGVHGGDGGDPTARGRLLT